MPHNQNAFITTAAKALANYRAYLADEDLAPDPEVLARLQAAVEAEKPAGYVAILGTNCMGFGVTPQEAKQAFEYQVSGALPSMRGHMRSRLQLQPVDAETASEVIEMLAAPWA